MDQYTHLFQEGFIRGTRVKNRIVMSPMATNLAASDGCVSDDSLAYYLERAKGGTGIIIPGGFIVDYPVGKSVLRQHRIDDRRAIAPLQKMARAVHAYGTVLIPQIMHAAAQTEESATEGLTPVCPSASCPTEHMAIKYKRMYSEQRTMTIDEIKATVQKFIKAAKNCQEAECDGVEVHAAHGYLISEFLSLDTNDRTDEYGCGSLENRMRFGVEVVTGIRKECGNDFIIGVRMPGKENTSRGLTDEECRIIAKTFEDAGADFLDISYGTSRDASRQCESYVRPQGSKVDYSRNIKKAVSIPVFCVGNLREPEFCENIIKNGMADYVVLGRQLLADPYWAKKAKEGRDKEIRKCISCMEECLNNILADKPIRCALNPTAGLESLQMYYSPTTPKKVVIIGGGPGGMQAAVTAAERGHCATLFEKEAVLGGQLNIACIPPDKHRVKWVTEWYENELTRLGVDVKLGKTATLQDVKKLEPDLVIVASGAVPAVAPIKGIEAAINAWSLLAGKETIPNGKRVAILGGGIVGCETALYLKKNGGCDVQIFEMMDQFATGMGALPDLLDEFETNSIIVNVNSRITKVGGDKIEYTLDGVVKDYSCDYIVAALGQKPYGLELVEELKKAGLETIVIGDATKSSKISGSVLAGYNAAHDL